jgi:hypothetical protein
MVLLGLQHTLRLFHVSKVRHFDGRLQRHVVMTMGTRFQVAQNLGVLNV